MHCFCFTTISPVNTLIMYVSLKFPYARMNLSAPLPITTLCRQEKPIGELRKTWRIIFLEIGSQRKQSSEFVLIASKQKKNEPLNVALEITDMLKMGYYSPNNRASCWALFQVRNIVRLSVQTTLLDTMFTRCRTSASVRINKRLESGTGNISMIRFSVD